MIRFLSKLKILLAVSLIALGLSANADVSLPVKTVATGDSCVEPVETMRRYHMEMLKHQRDDTMVRGIRTEKHSLVGCINCHAQKSESGDYIPVNDKDQFCESCHSYSAVKVDCFQCHRTTPDVEVSVSE